MFYVWYMWKMQERLDYKDIALEMTISRGNASILALECKLLFGTLIGLGQAKLILIHPSYSGQVCSIETPEGQNAGWITSVTHSPHVYLVFVRNLFGVLQIEQLLEEKLC